MEIAEPIFKADVVMLLCYWRSAFNLGRLLPLVRPCNLRFAGRSRHNDRM